MTAAPATPSEPRRPSFALPLEPEAAPPGRRQDARPSTGRTPFVTQQPLGGKGAVRQPAFSVRWKSGRWKPTAPPTSCGNATVKSDDVQGRTRCTEVHRQGERDRRRHAGIVQRAGQKSARSASTSGWTVPDPGSWRDGKARPRPAAPVPGIRKDLHEILLDLFKQFRPTSISMRSASAASPERSVPGPSVKSKKPGPSTTAPSSPGAWPVLRQDLRSIGTTSACAAKYKRLKHRGVICEMRRQKSQTRCAAGTLGPIMTWLRPAAPISGFLKSLPSRLGMVLDAARHQARAVLRNLWMR